MAAGHDHSERRNVNENRLRWALVLTGSYLLIQVIGGLVSGSLALLSDAAHMFTDVMGLVVALIAIQLGKRAADKRRTFGYARFEILAAAFNAAVLFIVAFYILYEAYKRFFAPPEIQSGTMLFVALGGLLINLVAWWLLRSSSGDSLNMRGAYLEVISDLLGSVAVIVGAIIIAFTGWAWVDPLLGALIGLWVLPRTWMLLSQSVNVLLEGVPEGVDILKLQGDLATIPDVADVHDLHVWAITSGQNSLSVHLVTASPTPAILEQARAVAEKHGIEHTTIQLDTPELADKEEGIHARYQ